jgi:hypothetical protein
MRRWSKRTRKKLAFFSRHKLIEKIYTFDRKSVYIFVMAGSMMSSYEVIVNNEEYIAEKIPKKKEWYYEIIMGIAAFIFLGIGFIWNAWHPGWIIFPITGLLTEGYIRLKEEKR